MMRFLVTLFFITLTGFTCFSQVMRGTGATTLNPVHCPTLTPESAYNLCVSNPATITPVVLTQPGSTLVYQWMIPSTAYVSGSRNDRNLITGYGGVYTLTAANATTGCTYVMTYTVEECVGIKENRFDALVSVSPNPCSDQIDLTASGPLTVLLVDVFGKAVLSRKLNEGKNSIDLHELQGGVYYLRMSTATGSKTMKLLKQ